MTFVAFTSEELATGPLADIYPRLGSVGIIIGQMDDEYNVQFSPDCFDDGSHESAEECALILSRDEFESADIFAAQVLNNYNVANSVPTGSLGEESCNCDSNCKSDYCSYDEREEGELTEEDAENLEIYKMLLPKFKKNGFITEDNKIEEGLDVVRMVSLAYKSAYKRGKVGRPFFFKKDSQARWREMKPNDVYNTSLRVMYVNKPSEAQYPEGPWDDGKGYFPPEGTVGRMSRPAWDDAESDEDIWVQFEGTEYEHTCYGQMFDCFLVREVDEDD